MRMYEVSGTVVYRITRRTRLPAADALAAEREARRLWSGAHLALTAEAEAEPEIEVNDVEDVTREPERGLALV
jgi:hypothetical protein